MPRIACRAAYGPEHGGVTDNAPVAHFFMPGIRDQILDLTQGPVAPGGRPVIEQFGCAAERLTDALLDRLTHQVHILKMNGESYRLNTAANLAKPNAQSPQPGLPTAPHSFVALWGHSAVRGHGQT